MIGDQLSKQEDRELHRALESVARTQFPNPRRNDCPGTETLRAIATKRISMRDPAVDHVGHCSPCFSELTALRRALYRRVVFWKAGAVAAAVIVLAATLSYVMVKWDRRDTTGLITTHQTATLDFRSASVPRSVQQNGLDRLAAEIVRGPISLTILLPVGSEAGLYDVEIRKPDQEPKARTQGEAHIRNGITTVTVEIDTSDVPAGEYQLAWRMPDFDWRQAQIVIR